MAELSDIYVYVKFRHDGRPCYVGIGRGKRHYHAGHHNRHLAAISVGRTIPTVIIRSGLSKAEAVEIEIALIAAIGREVDGGCLVNFSKGGEGPFGVTRSIESKNKLRAFRTGKPAWNKGIAVSDEQKRKISETLTGRQLTPEHVLKMRQAMLGKKHTLETRAKIGRWGKNNPAFGKPAPNRGKPMTEEHKAKLRGPNLNKRWPRAPMSESTKVKLSEARTGFKLSPESLAARRSKMAANKNDSCGGSIIFSQ